MITTIIALASLALAAHLALQVRALRKTVEQIRAPAQPTPTGAVSEVELSTAVKDALDLHLRNYHKGR